MRLVRPIGLVVALVGVACLETVTAATAGAAGNGQIAFTRLDIDGRNDVWVMNPDGSNPRNLTNSPESEGGPAFSPDGQRIVFSRSSPPNNGTMADIYVMNADGSGQTRLTQASGYNSTPAYSPDGQRIVFSRTPDGRYSDVWIMNADGSGQAMLAASGTPNEAMPVFSPDGQQVAFTSYRDGNDEIYVVNIDGTGARNLTNSAELDGNASFSPDGQRIAFESDRSDDFKIYVMNADGSSQTRLTSGPADDESPSFSPDGREIAFATNRGGGTIYTMRADGSDPMELLRSPAAQPAWGTLPYSFDRNQARECRADALFVGSRARWDFVGKSWRKVRWTVDTRELDRACDSYGKLTIRLYATFYRESQPARRHRVSPVLTLESLRSGHTYSRKQQLTRSLRHLGGTNTGTSITTWTPYGGTGGKSGKRVDPNLIGAVSP